MRRRFKFLPHVRANARWARCRAGSGHAASSVKVSRSNFHPLAPLDGCVVRVEVRCPNCGMRVASIIMVSARPPFPGDMQQFVDNEAALLGERLKQQRYFD